MRCFECGAEFVPDDEEEDVCPSCQLGLAREAGVPIPDDCFDGRGRSETVTFVDEVIEGGYGDEPIGSCEQCGSNLYVEDDLDYCQQCLWSIEQGKGSEDVGGSGIMPLG